MWKTKIPEAGGPEGWVDILHESTEGHAPGPHHPPTRGRWPLPPTHQGLSLLDLLSPGSSALPHHLDRSGWVSGGLQGENSIVVNQDVEDIQLLNGNLLDLLTMQCFTQHALSSRSAGRPRGHPPCRAPGPVEEDLKQP